MSQYQNHWEQQFGTEQLLLPGVHNALAAKLAKAAGFRSVYVTGEGVANNFLGEPDLGFLTFDQLKAHVEQVCCNIDLPVFVDFDSGYGDIKIAYRNAKILYSLGIAGLFIEDQEQSNRCGPLSGKKVVSPYEMEAKIAALRDISDQLLIVARTDALAIEGENSAFERIERYHKAGADVTLFEAPASREQLQKISQLSWPQAVNVIEGAELPILKDELVKLGFSIVLFANFASRMAMRSMQIAYKTLFNQGDTSMLIDEMMPFDDGQRLVGISYWTEFEEIKRVPAKMAHRNLK